MPWSAAAGRITRRTSAPEWTPVPDKIRGAPSVVCRCCFILSTSDEHPRLQHFWLLPRTRPLFEPTPALAPNSACLCFDTHDHSHGCRGRKSRFLTLCYRVIFHPTF